ncbi:hypothetical protein [Streptomyces sp. MP131-18]|uniref:hypothetical protein n=1 Tax=Streptomyces sp. MP131-18 TaxID=1857892 RepID=UPI00097CBEEE|nr:hypothetical protein [Streptomyces sp. MP131-18]ONK09283.1 hypothetical protein STBA_71380 [Streptomyces sp. MP131-18]
MILALLLGPQQAARVVRQLADDLIHQDRIDPDRALRIVCDRALAGDPLLLAAPGQTWTLRDDIDPDEAPARRLVILGRLTGPARIVVADPDLPDSCTDELLLDVLELYELETWHLPDALLDGEGDGQ